MAVPLGADSGGEVAELVLDGGEDLQDELLLACPAAATSPHANVAVSPGRPGMNDASEASLNPTSVVRDVCYDFS